MSRKILFLLLIQGKGGLDSERTSRNLRNKLHDVTKQKMLNCRRNFFQNRQRMHSYEDKVVVERIIVF
jgi:hypothetical protein